MFLSSCPLRTAPIFPFSRFPFNNFISSLNNVIASGSKNAFRNIPFTTSNFFFSGFFKVCHKNSWTDCLRTFRNKMSGSNDTGMIIKDFRKKEVSA